MEHATFKSYVIGFVLSIFLTLAAFFTVIRPGFFGLGSSAIVVVIMGCAISQFVIQAIFFLHLAQESKPRWNLVVFFSTLSIVLILVIGSIWIMGHLTYNMTPTDMNSYLLHQENLHPQDGQAGL